MTQSGDFDYFPPLPPGFVAHGDRPVDSSAWHDHIAGGINHLRDQSGQILANWMATSTGDELGPNDDTPGRWYEAARIPLILRMRPDGRTHGLVVHLRCWNAGTDGDTTSARWRWYLMTGLENFGVGIEPFDYAAADGADATVGTSASSEWLTGDSGKSLYLTTAQVARSRPLGFSVDSSRAGAAQNEVRPLLAWLIVGVEPQGTANTGTTLRGYQVREFDSEGF